MKPIQERAELALMQALRCVQFRLPNRYELKPRAYSCALALRYGLVGAAGAFYALETADFQEERELKSIFQHWPLMVTEHFQNEVFHRVPFEADAQCVMSVGRLSGMPFRLSLSLRRQFMPLQNVLEVAADMFRRDQRFEITSESGLFSKRKAAKAFEAASDESIRFSMYFFDRRRASLDEVSEIALLGE